MREQDVRERFEVRRRDCLIVATVRQAWHRGITDLEVVYDDQGRPLRVVKRMVLPDAPDDADLRLYELRSTPPTLSMSRGDEAPEYRELRGPTPDVVIGPGRGLVSLWLQAAGLAVGERARAHVLDLRGIETIEPAVLERNPDRVDPTLGAVRVYTFFGRETVFADERDVVIGDLAGLRSTGDADASLPWPDIPVPDFHVSP
jgi:hypothetical protein